jgi:hypothetical protein
MLSAVSHAGYLELIVCRFMKDGDLVLVCPDRQRGAIFFIPKFYLKFSYVDTSFRHGCLFRCAKTDEYRSMLPFCYLLFDIVLQATCKLFAK